MALGQMLWSGAGRVRFEQIIHVSNLFIEFASEFASEFAKRGMSAVQVAVSFHLLIVE